jgi:hypothetical protein
MLVKENGKRKRNSREMFDASLGLCDRSSPHCPAPAVMRTSHNSPCYRQPPATYITHITFISGTESKRG